MRAISLRTAAVAVVVAVAPAAVAEARVQVAERAGATPAAPFFDVRTAARERAGLRSARPGRVADDAVTGTVRAYHGRGRALSGPSARGAVVTARAFAADNRARLGLDTGDLDQLEPDATVAGTQGLRVVRFRQQVDGIPFFDNGLRVGL